MCNSVCDIQSLESTSDIGNMTKDNLKAAGATTLSFKHVGMQLVAGGSAGCVEVNS